MTTYLQFCLITCYSGLPHTVCRHSQLKMWIWLNSSIHRVNLNDFTLVSKIKLSSPNWRMCVTHSCKIHIIPSTLSKLSQQGCSEAGQSFMLSQLLSGAPQLSAPSSPHTLYLGKIRPPHSVWGPTVTSETHTHQQTLTPERSPGSNASLPHFTGLDLYRRWDWWWAGVSGADGDLIFVKSQSETSAKLKLCRNPSEEIPTYLLTHMDDQNNW